MLPSIPPTVLTPWSAGWNDVFHPVEKGLLADARGARWTIFHRHDRFAILARNSSEPGKVAPWRWAAATPNGRMEWVRLAPGPWPTDTASHLSPFKRLGWKASGPKHVTCIHPVRLAAESGDAFDVSYNGGGIISFFIAHHQPRDAYNPLLERKPRLCRIADAYGILPPALMRREVERVYVHRTAEYSRCHALYHMNDETRVDHFPSFCAPSEKLEEVVAHEVIGHGLFSKTPAAMALWVGLTILDGGPTAGHRQNVEEDWAQVVERYACGRQPRSMVHRLAGMSLLVQPDGRRISDRAIRGAFDLFRIEGETFTMQLPA